MDNANAYVIEFRLADSDDASPSEFRHLFGAVDDLTRNVVMEQVILFAETTEMPERAREEIFSESFRLARHIVPPVQVINIRRQSPWTILAGLPIAGVIWAIRKMIAPQVLQAWNESRLQELFHRFVRDYIFMGTKERLEKTAGGRPQYGNLVIDDIRETGRHSPGEPEISITFRRTEVLSIDVKDRELRDEFLRRLGLK